MSNFDSSVSYRLLYKVVSLSPGLKRGTEAEWVAFSRDVLSKNTVSVFLTFPDLLFLPFVDSLENRERVTNAISSFCPASKQVQLPLVLNKLFPQLFISLVSSGYAQNSQEDFIHSWDQYLHTLPHNRLRFLHSLCDRLKTCSESYWSYKSVNWAHDKFDETYSILAVRVIAYTELFSKSYCLRDPDKGLLNMYRPYLVAKNDDPFYVALITRFDKNLESISHLDSCNLGSELMAVKETLLSFTYEDGLSYDGIHKFNSSLQFRADCFDPNQTPKRLQEITTEIACLNRLSSCLTLNPDESKFIAYACDIFNVLKTLLLKSEESWLSLQSQYTEFESRNESGTSVTTSVNQSYISELNRSFEASIDAAFKAQMSRAENRERHQKAMREASKIANTAKKQAGAEAHLRKRAQMFEKLNGIRDHVEEIRTKLVNSEERLANIANDLQDAKTDLLSLSMSKCDADIKHLQTTILTSITDSFANPNLVFYSQLQTRMTNVPHRRPLSGSRDFFLGASSNPDLRDLLSEQYRETATIGDGGTAAILRQEVVEQRPIKCNFTHYYKAKYAAIALARLFHSDLLNPIEYEIAHAVWTDLNASIQFANKSAAFQQMLNTL